MSQQYSSALLEHAVDEFSKLPGIGRKTAMRLVLHMLRLDVGKVETFTDAVIKAVSDTQEHVVFILWGGYARSKKYLIDKQKHLILESVHPSPLSANRGGWFGNHHFSQCNAYLEQHGKEKINW